MSMEQHPGSTLPGWQGPFYPKALATLAEAYQGRKTRNGSELMYLGSLTKGYVTCDRPVAAADGYGWFWGMEYQIGGTRIMVAFPWGGDAQCRDGVGWERSPAIYVKGSYQQRAVDDVLTDLTRAMREAPPADERG